MTTLLAARFENNDTLASPLEQFSSIEALGVRWQLRKYGTSRIEATVRRSDSYSAYDAYSNWQGQRFAVYSGWTHLPISGWITECVWETANKVKIIAKGPDVRMMEQLIRRFYSPSTTISTVIENTLDFYVRIDDGTTDEIESNTTTTGGWSPDAPQGEYANDVIDEMLKRSNANFDITDFWFQDNPMSAGKLQQFKPYYRARPTTVITPDWVVYRRDLSNLNLSRGINNVTTVSRIYHGLVTGTITGITATRITDAAATFITDGVVPGDKITNTSTGGSSQVINVVSQTQIDYDGWKAKTSGTCTGGSTTTLIDTTVDFVALGVLIGDVVTNLLDNSTGTITGLTQTTLTIGGSMSGGKQNDAGERYEVSAASNVTDNYSIATTTQNAFEERQVDAGTEKYWQSERSDFIRNANATQAGQIANSQLSNDAEQEQSFVINSAFIRDGNGSLWPLHEVIAQGGGTIQVVDLFPEATASLNQETVFTLTAMDYDHTSRRLRCTVDNLDARLDARLEQQGILQSTMVSRG